MKLDLSNMILNSDVHLISSNHNHYFFCLCKRKNENNSNSGIGKDSLGCIKTLLVTEVFKTHIELRIALFCKPPSRQGPPVDIYKQYMQIDLKASSLEFLLGQNKELFLLEFKYIPSSLQYILCFTEPAIGPLPNCTSMFHA